MKNTTLLLIDKFSSEKSQAGIEEIEKILLQDLRMCVADSDLIAITKALAGHGTILAVPTLAAMSRNDQQGHLYPVFREAIALIGERAKIRGTLMPDEYFTLAHWKLYWDSSIYRFVSYAAVVADFHKTGNETEFDRVGDILVNEMSIDITPFENFHDFRICQTAWDFDSDLGLIMDRIEQERLMNELDDTQVTESFASYLLEELKELQYNYLATRLGFVEDFEYRVFALKIADCLNNK